MSQDIIRVLVVDDHPIVRRGLCAEINLNQDMVVVAEAENGEEAISKAKIHNPDVILMDIVMPKKNGIEATKEIIQNDPDARILILTSFTDDEKIFAAIRAGALGYIYKDRHPDKVLEAIRKMKADIPVLNPSIARRLFKEIRDNKQKSKETTLTQRENEVLRSVVSGRSYKSIANELFVQETTVRAHVSNILRKLDLENRSQLIMYAVKNHLIDGD